YVYWDDIGRFDGNNWMNFNISNSPIPSTGVSDMILRQNGDSVFAFWQSGIGIYNPPSDSWIFYDTSNSNIGHHSANSVYEAVDGKLWFTYYDKYFIESFDGNTWTRYYIPNISAGGKQPMDII